MLGLFSLKDGAGSRVHGIGCPWNELRLRSSRARGKPDRVLSRLAGARRACILVQSNELPP